MYRDQLFTLNPELYSGILQGYNERTETRSLVLGREYLEIVQQIAEVSLLNV